MSPDGDRPTPYADVLPPLSTETYANLVADIRAHGLRSPILVDAIDGAVIDGHHRLRACLEARMVPVFTEATFSSDDEREATAIALNLHRRNMSPEQLRVVLERQRTIFRRLRASGLTQQQAAAILGRPRDDIKHWDISKGDIPNPYDQRVTVPPALRPVIADRVAAGEPQTQIAADYGITQPRVSQIAAIHEAAQREPEPVETPGFPTGPFRAIVIDPPWPVEKAVKETRPHQGVALDYPTMSLADIAALPINELADQRGAHLYLWTTHRLLPDALEIAAGWGFRYQCLLTWVKPVGVSPFSWMYDTEHVIFARCGGLDLLRMGLRLSLNAPQQPHSRKPHVFYERVAEASPGRRLEMFSRQVHDGFEAWGAEAVHA